MINRRLAAISIALEAIERIAENLALPYVKAGKLHAIAVSRLPGPRSNPTERETR